MDVRTRLQSAKEATVDLSNLLTFFISVREKNVALGYPTVSVTAVLT